MLEKVNKNNEEKKICKTRKFEGLSVRKIGGLT